MSRPAWSVRYEDDVTLSGMWVAREVERDEAIGLLRLCIQGALCFKTETRNAEGLESVSVIAIDTGDGTAVVVWLQGSLDAENLSDLPLYAEQLEYPPVTRA